LKSLLEIPNLMKGSCKSHLVTGFIANDDQGGPLASTGGVGVLGGDSRTRLRLRGPEFTGFVLRQVL
jgi:hypothetical protein